MMFSRLAYSTLVLITTYLSFITVVAPGTDFTRNVALNKSVSCYPDGDLWCAFNRAVDGNDSTVSGSRTPCSNCSVVVNLGESVYIRKLRIVTDYVTNFTLLTSNNDSPEPPSLLSNDWTIRYFAPSSGSQINVINVTLYLDELSSHVAVYNEYDRTYYGLSELEVYSYDVSYIPPNLVSSTSEVDSSSVYSNATPSLAVDQNRDMFDAGSYFNSKSASTGGKTPHWWRVKLDIPVASQCVVTVYPFLRKEKAYSTQFNELNSFDVMLSKEDEPGAPLQDNSKWVQCVPSSRHLISYYINGPVITICQPTAVKYVGLWRTTLQSFEIGEVRVYEADCSTADIHCDAGRIHNDDVKPSCYDITDGDVITYQLQCYDDQHVINDIANQFQWSLNKIFISCNSVIKPITWSYTEMPGAVAMGVIQPGQILDCKANGAQTQTQTQAGTGNRPTTPKPTNRGTQEAYTWNGILMLIMVCIEIASTSILT